jgi:2-dehydro-3-deoxyglucarate aldolase
MAESLKTRLAAGEATFGSWLSFNSPLLAEMMAKAGFDWMVVDMEHSSSATSEMAAMIQVIDLAGCVPLVRVGANDPLLIKRALDAGAEGVVVPMVCSKAEAEAARDAVYYPPKGKRGVGLSRAQGFGMGFDAYRDSRNDRAVLIVQIEHVRAVEAIEEILSVPEVDGFIIGPYDMSGSIGKPGKFDDPEVKALLDRCASVIKAHPKPGGYHIVHSDRALVERRLAEGSRFIAYGTEMIFLAEKLRDEGGFLASLRDKK